MRLLNWKEPVLMDSEEDQAAHGEVSAPIPDPQGKPVLPYGKSTANALQDQRMSSGGD